MSLTIYPAPTQNVTGTVKTTQDVPFTDGSQYDDDGVIYVNPNVAGADIATGDKQSILNNLIAQLLTMPSIASNAVTVTNIINAAIASMPLAPNQAIENAGNIQRIADNIEALVIESKVQNTILSQLGQALPDDAEKLRNDVTLN